MQMFGFNPAKVVFDSGKTNEVRGIDIDSYKYFWTCCRLPK